MRSPPTPLYKGGVRRKKDIKLLTFVVKLCSTLPTFLKNTIKLTIFFAMIINRCTKFLKGFELVVFLPIVGGGLLFTQAWGRSSFNFSPGDIVGTYFFSPETIASLYSL
ncbi:hypothetical protein PCC7424_3104 [Gloeothece citriformis PCC 7424]|uniref:Uncharacterized protein n=1 Tax=Gloeothece citriformis (strain PCC 7424) TaxID=65393 RepID=B7KBF0_GLOC7|nr:hypothetical protein PCC7424_3104 [Gloeothece citriformis PCC 7424]